MKRAGQSGLVATFVVLLVSLFLLVSRQTPRRPQMQPARNYSFIGKDYPRTWPIAIGKVHKAVEDSMHYSHEMPLGSLEWNSTLPSGGGVLHLGLHGRTFSVSMFHQLRCLNIVGREIVQRSRSSTPLNITILVHHCMNYLRQMILCRADTRLEPAYNIIGPRIVTSSITHTCNDWSAVYAAAEENYSAYARG